MKQNKLTLIALAVAVIGAASSATAADSTGKDLRIIKSPGGGSIPWKAHDNGDDSVSMTFATETQGGTDIIGKVLNMIDGTTGKSIHWRFIDLQDGTYAPLVSIIGGGGGGGSGDVVGPASATDNAVARFNGTTGKSIQNSGVTIDDSGNLTSNNSPNWNTAFTDRLKWDGGSSGLTASTGRTSLGATTVGANIFTLTNPGAISWLEIAADNSVSTKSASQTRTDLGLAIGTDVVPAPSVQTVGDADVTWLSGKDFLIQAAAITANRAETLPAANSAIAGTVRTFVDAVTSTSSTFAHTFLAAGSDTINGNASYAAAAGPVTVSFVTDGSSAWTKLYAAAQPSFGDMRDKLTDDQAALLGKPASALVASSNITLSGNQTVDGVTGTNGTTIVLCIAQSTGSQNGFWIMQSSSWTRPAWYSSGSTVQGKQFMTSFVRLGTHYSGHTMRCTTSGTITIDTTATTWTDTPLAVNSDSIANGVQGSGAVVLATQPALTGPTLANGSTSVPPLTFGTGGSLKTSPVAGAFEADAKVAYYTHATSERGVLPSIQWIGLTSTYTLANQTAAQQLFNATTNGRVTVAANTTYRFKCHFSLSSMSASSGTFGFAIGGSATISGIDWKAVSAKAALNAASGSPTTLDSTNAANTALTANNTTTTGFSNIEGRIRVTTGGTIQPQVSLGVAAAAVVGVDSWFEIWPVGSDTATSVGNWD